MADTTAYKYELSAHQTLYIGGQGLMTVVTLQSGSPRQQQQSSNQFSTGKWTAVPLLYRVGQGIVVVISTLAETYYLQVQGNQMQMSAGAVSAELEAQMSQSQTLPLQPADAMPAGMPAMNMPSMGMPSMGMPVMNASSTDMPPMPQMQPMQPMSLKMGDMEMNMGEMTMGGMTMGKMNTLQDEQEGKVQKSRTQESRTQESGAQQKTKRFCTQCGSPAELGDKFCGHCGNQLA